MARKRIECRLLPFRNPEPERTLSCKRIPVDPVACSRIGKDNLEQVANVTLDSSLQRCRTDAVQTDAIVVFFYHPCHGPYRIMFTCCLFNFLALSTGVVILAKPLQMTATEISQSVPELPNFNDAAIVFNTSAGRDRAPNASADDNFAVECNGAMYGFNPNIADCEGAARTYPAFGAVPPPPSVSNADRSRKSAQRPSSPTPSRWSGESGTRACRWRSLRFHSRSLAVRQRSEPDRGKKKKSNASLLTTCPSSPNAV